jgi:hypothetical protein
MPWFIIHTRGTQNLAVNKKFNKKRKNQLFKSFMISFVHIFEIGKIIYKQTLYIG